MQFWAPLTLLSLSSTLPRKLSLRVAVMSMNIESLQKLKGDKKNVLFNMIETLLTMFAENCDALRALGARDSVVRMLQKPSARKDLLSGIAKGFDTDLMQKLSKPSFTFEDCSEIDDIEVFEQTKTELAIKGIYLILYRRALSGLGSYIGHSLNIESRMQQHEKSRAARNEKGIYYRWSQGAEVLKRILLVDINDESKYKDKSINMLVAK